MSPGEKARRARKRAEQQEKWDAAMSSLRAQGACCGSCEHFREPCAGIAEYTCELGNDFHGYQVTSAEKLCPSYKRKEPQP